LAKEKEALQKDMRVFEKLLGECRKEGEKGSEGKGGEGERKEGRKGKKDGRKEGGKG
jgi:hypothetical protein